MKAAHLLWLGLVLAVAPPGSASPPLPGPGYGPPPLLFVRFSGPAGSRTFFYQGDPAGKGFDLPVTVGLRPGYHYRVQLTDLPQHPGVALFPTLEVRGTIAYPPWV